MCEQTPVEYKNGDIVWVKLGPCWWPGEVQDLESIEETIVSSFKKPLIAAVKFFNEDTYAYIRSLDQIYSYSCSKKNEFIKKGLDLCRAKHEYMRKFPEDVCKAEIETNGNPNIIDDPIFAPETRVNVTNLFGKSKQKKTPRRSSGSPRKSLGSKATTNSPKTSGKKVITHPRFVGHCDHEVKICVQAANRLISDSEEERNMYTCTLCAFSTDRIGVIIPHHKSHLYSYGTASIHTSKKRKNTPVKGNKKLRMTKSKTSSILEDLDLIEKGLLVQTESSDERDDTLESNCDNESVTKRKTKRTKKKLKEQESKKLKTIVDVCGDLLAEWNDESEEFGSEAALDVTSSTEDSQLPNTELKGQNRENQKRNEKVDDDMKKDDKSCFDFEEDDINEIIGTTLHRKIPRVIPPPERPKSAKSDEIKDNFSSSENNADIMQDGSTQLQTTNDDVASIQSQNSNNDVCSAELQGTNELCPAQSQGTNEVCSTESKDTNEVSSAQPQGTDEVCSLQLQDTNDDVCSAQLQDINDDICSVQTQGTKDDVCSAQSQGTHADVCLPQSQGTNDVYLRQSQGTNDDVGLPQSQGPNDDVCLPQSQGIDDVCSTRSQGTNDDVCLLQSQGVNDDVCSTQSQSTNDDVCLPQSQGVNDDVCSTQSQGTNDDVCSAKSRDTNDDVCSTQSPDTNDDVCSSQSQDTNDDASSVQSQDTNDEVCSAQSQDTNDDVCSAQLRNINDDGIVEFNNHPNQDNLESLEISAIQEFDKSHKQHDTSNLVNEVEEQELIPNKTNTNENNDVEEVKDDDTDELAFKNMLDATSMPDLPEMPHSLKFEQNLHDSKKIKFPDKQTPPSTPPKTEVKEICTSSRLINPKKRFVKSFEDFEQQINKQQKKLLEQHEKASENIESEDVVIVDSELGPKVTDKVLEKTSTVKVSKLKTQLMHKLGNVEGIEETTKQTKRPQLLRDRILTSHREDNSDEPLNFTDMSNEIETSTINDMILNNTVGPQYPQKICELPEELLQACNSLHVESTVQPDLMPVIKIAEIDGEKQKENKENLSLSPNLVEAPATEAPDNTNIVHESEARKYNFKRRFSAQIFEPVESKIMEVQNIQSNVDENQHLESTHLQLTTAVQEEKLNKVEENLTETVVDTKAVLETEPTLKSEPIFKSQTVLETETVLGIEAGLETAPMLESEPTLQTEPVLKTEMILETELVLNAETEPILDTILDTKPIIETGTSSVSETESISESEPVSNTGPISEGELVSGTEEISKTVPETSEQCADLIKIAHSLHTDGEDAGEKSAVENNQNSENVIDTSVVESKIEETDNQSVNCVGVVEDVNSSAMIESNISFSCANLDNQNADLSALTTLATISELSTNLDVKCTSSSEKTKIIENNLTSACVDLRDKNNLNFVTVDDLADAQVEISDSSISKVKSIPINLASFSVDFPESHQTASDSYESISKSILIQEEVVEQVSQPDSIEMSLGKVFEGENDSESKPYKSDTVGILETDSFDLEDHIPSLLVCNSKSLLGKKFKTILSERSKPEYSSSSKLLEILTDSKPKCSLDSETLQSSPDTEIRDNGEKQVIYKETVVASNKNVTKSKDEKCEKSLNVIKENNSVSKITLKLKDDKPLNVSKEASSVSKVLSKNKDDKPYTITKESSVAKNLPKPDSKVILKSSVLKPFSPSSLTKSSKPIILSEKIIKTMSDSSETVSVQKVTSKRSTQDVEDIDTFIIQKPPKKIFLSESAEVETFPKKMSRGRAKILQQTIIKPSGDIIQPAVTSLDDTMFDINSMPIVLGDQILTTEVIESMPVVISETQEVVTTKPQTEQKILNKPTSTQPMLLNTYSSQKLGKSRIYHTTPTSATKILKSNPAIISRPGKQDKYIILPSSTTASTSKYTVGKKTMTKRMAPVIVPTSNIAQKLQTTVSESSGNKIMIVTNQQGQQSRVLLTPAQQKLFGYQSPGSKLVKSTVKSNILQKTTARSSVVTTISTVQTKVSQTITNSQEGLTPSNPNLTTELVSLKPTNTLRNVKTVSSKGGRLQIQQQKGLQEGFSSFKNQSKTIVIKNQQGQIVKKLHTDDAVLEQQVAEQVQAIKASSSTINTCSKIKSPAKRSYKKSEPQKNVKLVSTAAKLLKTEVIPPLAPISPKRTDSLLLSQAILKIPENSSDATKSESSQKPLSQLIIQDALGNQTSIMEGQILALPSGETLDGQPQSYMLVTLDESGNLTPLNNEALLSLDPNLTLGGDLSNMVLQVDDSINKKSEEPNTSNNESLENLKMQETLQPHKASTKTEGETSQNVQTVTCSIGNDLNQQLIITGDPITAQKFIESLTEANPDLANLLASAEGNILIQTDEQQILINTDSDNQLLLPINAGAVDNEGDSNPIFATQPVKNQDILAAALADTDVFQQEHTVSPVHSKITQQAQLSPNSGLYQAGVANVLETTLSLSSPIMTPLEVPSTNNKKIPDEEMDILTTEVPKNVDLPITITDPNISQTVAQQQVASLMASELSTNLDLPLTIAETVVTPLSSTELSSPSYVYPLSTLDESVANVDVQKSFSGPISMPLLTEDPQETISDPILEQSEVLEHIIEQKSENRNAESAPKRYVKKRLQELPEERSILGRLKRRSLFESSPLTDSIIRDDRRSPPKAFLVGGLDTEEGLCTLGGAMCSSLSEPPPDMFDLSIVTSHFDKSLLHRSLRTENEPNRVDSSTELNESNDGFNKYQYQIGNKIKPSSLLSIPEISSSNSPVVNVDENSCEIPVQPQIVTDLSSTSFGCMDVVGFETNKRVGCDYNNDHDRKKMKFD